MNAEIEKSMSSILTSYILFGDVIQCKKESEGGGIEKAVN